MAYLKIGQLIAINWGQTPIKFVVNLAQLCLLKRTESGGVSRAYTSMHIDMYLKAA